MVNVGGRSKGCSTCRKRRVKCDETRPICRRCARWGLECTGVKDTSFIEAKIVKLRRSIKPEIAFKEDDSSMTCVVPQMCLTRSMKSNHFEMYFCYSRKYLQSGGLLNLAVQNIEPSEIMASGTSTAKGPIFHQAILSFATMIFGGEHKDSHIINQGYFIRGLVLKRLNQALSEPDCYTRDEILLSVVALAIMECFVPTGPGHYLQHMIGLERLLELRGPGPSVSQGSSKIYKGLRHMIVFASLRTRRPSILARPEWKTALRASCSEEEMHKQELFEILADCTVLAAERKHVPGECGVHLRIEFGRQGETTQRALLLLTQLHLWRERWDAEGMNFHFESPSALENLDSIGAPYKGHHPFSTAFEFLQTPAAVMYMFYNTTLIHVLRILGMQQQSDIHNGKQDDYVFHERLAALEICRCIPYYLVQKSRLNLEMSPLFHWAVTTAWRSLGGDESPEGLWVTEIMKVKGRGVIAQGVWTLTDVLSI